MKIFLSIITGTVFMFSGLTPIFGFDLLKNTITPDKGATYSFGVHYRYDNAGSSWDHDRVYRLIGYHHHQISEWQDCDYKLFYFRRHQYYKPHEYVSKELGRHKTEPILSRFNKGDRCQCQR